MPPFEPERPENFVERPAVYERFDEALQYHRDANQKPCFVVYGATGSGKTEAINAWLRSRGHTNNVISVACNRTWDDEILEEIASKLNGRSMFDAMDYIEKNRPIIHLNVIGEEEESDWGKGFINFGRWYSPYSFIILDLPPRSVDLTWFLPELSRFHYIVVPEFNVSEALEFLSKSNQSNPFPRWLPQAAHNGSNDTLARMAMRRIAEVTVGTNPSRLHALVKNNESETQLEAARLEARVDAKAKLAEMKPKERRVIRDLVLVAYDDGIEWPLLTIKPSEFHRFPMLRSLLHSSLESRWRLHFTSVVEHDACNATIGDFMLTDRVLVLDLNATTHREPLWIDAVERNGQYSVHDLVVDIQVELAHSHGFPVDASSMAIAKRVDEGQWSAPLHDFAPLAANESMSFGWYVPST